MRSGCNLPCNHTCNSRPTNFVSGLPAPDRSSRVRLATACCRAPKALTDLQAKIKAKADALVSKREVSSAVSTAKADTERVLLDANAQVIADVRMGHRADIRRFRRLCVGLLEELEAETSDIELFRELGEMLRSEDDKGQDRRNDVSVRRRHLDQARPAFVARPDLCSGMEFLS